MKRICFGSLFTLMYQARGQGVKSDPLCRAIFAAFGVDLTYRDVSLPGHLKNGHDKIPSDIIDEVCTCDPENAVRGFETTVMGLIKDSMRAPLLLAIQVRRFHFGLCRQSEVSFKIKTLFYIADIFVSASC